MPDGGCHRQIPEVWIEGSAPSRTCPVTFHAEYDAIFVAWNRLYDSSLPDVMRLPILGGWAEQPPLFMACMALLQQTRAAMAAQP